MPLTLRNNSTCELVYQRVTEIVPYCYQRLSAMRCSSEIRAKNLGSLLTGFYRQNSCIEAFCGLGLALNVGGPLCERARFM